MERVLGDTFSTPNYKPVRKSDLQPWEFLLLFFGSNRNPPSKSICAKLQDFYKYINKDAHRIEVVYVGFEDEEQDWAEFFASMPWIGVPFQDKHRRFEMRSQFCPDGLFPKIIVLNDRFEVVSNRAKQEFLHFRHGAYVFWWMMSQPTPTKKAPRLEERKVFRMYLEAPDLNNIQYD